MRDDLKNVDNFLAVVKACLSNNDDWEYLTRPENRNFMAEHGLSGQIVKQQVEGLHRNNVYQGPMDDDDLKRKSGTIFVFRKPFQAKNRLLNIYIKIKILDETEYCIVVSFHEEGRSL